MFRRRVTTVENMLHPAFGCMVSEKMSIYESWEEKWQYISKSVQVPEKMRIKYTDGFKNVKSEKLE